VDRVAIPLRICKALQGYDTCSGTCPRALGIGVKRAAMTIGREDHAFLVEISCLVWEADRDPAGERHVTFAARQGPAGHFNSDKRC